MNDDGKTFIMNDFDEVSEGFAENFFDKDMASYRMAKADLDSKGLMRYAQKLLGNYIEIEGADRVVDEWKGKMIKSVYENRLPKIVKQINRTVKTLYEREYEWECSMLYDKLENIE